MLTQNEITALSLSPTKKDFVQIWNELLEVAGKLSERWDPTSTNESDPGIVLLKALTGIADKLNYNIDKNILEAFMPTAAQEDSMRKLCDMLGYNMKYYRSAETDVTIKYYNSDPSDEEAAAMAVPGQLIPKFTVITNSDKDISYFTINQTPVYLSMAEPSRTISCMEGQIVKCESSNDNNVITANHISENNRFYLPETMIAENGIFIYNATTSISGELADGERWTKVDNLNVQARESRVFKFGYDSYESRPYVEFPEDYGKLFNEGIFLYYTRTSGVNGNASPRTLTQIELPSTGNWSAVSAESLSVENVFAATSGANTETIKQAYNNFKKTVGTFETLVTCRDYMNKIYSFVEKGKPLVSNILVTDIRNDLNKAVTICSCDSAGIFYKDVPIASNIPVSENTKPVFSNNEWHLGGDTGITLPNGFVEGEGFNYKKTGEPFVKEGYWFIRQEKENVNKDYKTSLPVGNTEQAINHFDIVFYPFKSYSQVKSNVKDIRAVYDASFKYTENESRVLDTIKQRLNDIEETKTISHNIKTPDIGDVLSINNYIRLTATIATNSKVTTDESAIIIDNIKKALANAFNMRELDFGDEIPFDSIVEVIEGADTRIKVASLNEPALYTTFSVLESRDYNSPVIVEYAVASDWLDAEMVDKIDRFTKVNEDGKTISTFDTVEARKIYNKLAVRNVLAGRVPLFNYNNSFVSSFSESAYQVTNLIGVNEIPYGLAMPEPKEPFTLWTDGDAIYTGQYNSETENEEEKYKYTKTASVYQDNIITETQNGDTVDNYITDIKAECKLLADDNGVITDVTLAPGEFVKFRAPNFTTIKTYPAYVNYHLDLSKETYAEALPAEAISFFNVLDNDRKSWSIENTQIKWQKVLDYFESLDLNSDTKYKKTFTVAQAVSATSTPDGGEANITLGNSTTTIGVGVNNTPIENTEYTTELLATLSGCIKLINDGFKARVEWTPAEGESKPAGDVPLELILEDFTNPFITNVNVISELKTAIDTALATYKNNLPKECTQCSFTVYLDFECVPFEAKSLSAWEGFIRSCLDNFNNKNFKYQVLDFIPYDEDSTLFWRMFGDGYDIGKYVTLETEKLLKFSKNYFGLLADYSTQLHGIYLVKSIGADAKPVIIKNNEEYQLGSNEWLYIEYTPSTTTEDGATKDLTAVTEIYGEGTIIRPSGFDNGLLDSAVYTAMGNTPHKAVTFMSKAGSAITKNMHRFGASEQVEIRDFAKVTLSSDTFSDLYVYKNFNGELESGGSTYTLKDGESIFYTDKNQTEFAYFTSGTQVTLSKNVKLPEFDVIELSTILDSGIQEIPWSYLKFNAGDEITFQEYQYITLGSEDTIKSLVIIDNAKTDGNTSAKRYLSDAWQYCSDVEYTLASDQDTNITLPIINLQGERKGDGWEASSTLELDVSSSNAQALRNTDKVETSLTLYRTSTTGGSDGEDTISPKMGDFNTKLPLSFKTNLACQSCGNEINIDDVWSNPNNLKGFQLKVFATDEPVVVKTKPGTVIPYNYTGDIAAWSGDPLEAKEYLELWRQVNLEKIKGTTSKADGADNYDNALRLPISLLPNTYGVFCIYVNYTSTSAVNKARAWIEVIPGTKVGDISLLNANNAAIECFDSANTKLKRLYLNPGINCVRVNKTGKIFIKASSEAQGILYFDELRLVNSLPIKYTDVNKKHVPLNTQGLNLAQLGYLDASETDSDSLDTVAKAKLQKAYVDEMYAEVNTLVQSTEEEFAAGYSEIAELLPKVQVLVNTEKQIAAELASIGSIGDERLTKLIEKYKEVKETLEKETALLDALNNNVKADDLEQSLVTLLDSFTSIESAQQQILNELKELCAGAIKRLENISDKEILKDFSDASKAEPAKALAVIKTAVASKIEEHYHKQLTAIADSLNSSVASASKSTLLAILNSLKANATSAIRAELQTKVNELSNLVDNEIGSIVEEIDEATYQADGPDYSQLIALLTRLRNIVDSTDIRVLVSEIAQAINESNDEQLKKLLKPLFPNDTFDSAALSNATNSTILTKIKAVEDVAKVDKPDSSTVKTKVDALKIAISEDYTVELTRLFTAINTALDELATTTSSIDTILSSINAVEYSESDINSQVRQIINQLKDIIAERKRFISGEIVSGIKINGLIGLTNESLISWKTNTCATFIEDVILTTWPALINTRLSSLLVDVDNVFSEAFEKESSTLDRTMLTNLYKSETDIMRLLLNTGAIEALFDRIKPLLSAKEQSSDDASLVEDIGYLVLDSAELDKASEAFGKIENKNKVISGLIADWQAAEKAKDVKLKQKLQASLKEELTKVIDTHGQLLSIIANAFCPNLFKYINEFKAIGEPDENHNFIKNLLNKLESIETLLTSGEISNAEITVDSAYLELLEQPLADFKSDLEVFTLPAFNMSDDVYANTLLPNELIKKLYNLDSLLTLYATQKSDIDKLTAQPLDTMTSADISEDIKLSDESGLKVPLDALISKIADLERLTLIDTGYEDAFKILKLEEQLLAEIRAIDVNREFYYNAPVVASIAIDLNESAGSLNTLMNPQMNYDINNVNNSFVISKLDIDFLDSGIQIARSSRLN